MIELFLLLGAGLMAGFGLGGPDLIDDPEETEEELPPVDDMMPVDELLPPDPDSPPDETPEAGEPDEVPVEPPVDVTETLTDEADTLVGEEYRAAVIAGFDVLVAEGELSQSEADNLIAGIDFRDGAVNADAGAGDDELVGSSQDDTLLGGIGNDTIFGGAGNDHVEMGDGIDTYGIDSRTAQRADDLEPFPVQSSNLGPEQDLEGGDDTVYGQAGSDFIADGYGANTLLGGPGKDFIISVDQDALLPDVVSGGSGDDVLIVDQGDEVITGSGDDRVTVEVFDGVDVGYTEVLVTDFDPATDVLELEGEADILLPMRPADPNEPFENPVAVQDLPDGTGVLVLVDDVAVVRVIGGQGLTVGDIVITV